jgi:hypothetical protein
MKTLKLLLFTYLMSLPLFSYAETGREFFADPYISKEFPAQGVKVLDVQSSGSSIAVSSWDEDKVSVEIFALRNGKEVNANDLDIQEKLKDFQVEVDRSGDKVLVSIQSKNKSNWNMGKNNISFSIQVQVPEEMSTSFSSSGGSISLQGVEGNHDIRSSGGSIRIGDCEGNLTAKSSGGSFAISNFDGSADLNTSGGSVKVDNLSGAIAISSSGGSITLTDISGKVNASSSGGSIKASLISLEDELSLKASGGSISVALPQDEGMDLNIKGGSVSSQLAYFEGVKTRDQIIGKVNGGGIPVTLSTSGGSIKVDKR